MLTKAFRYISFVIAGLLLFPVYAQSDEPHDFETLESVLIQNQRIQIPFSDQNREIQVIDEKSIQSIPANSVAELLSFISGMDIRTRGQMGAQSDISINGGTFDQTLLLINGIKVIDPQTGHNMMNIPVGLSAIQRIEILKGPAAAAYGVNAMNGAINIITKQPSETGVFTRVETGSSFEKDSLSQHYYSGIDLNLSAALKTDNTKHFISLNHIESNGHRYNTSLRNQKVFYSNHLQLGVNSLSVSGGYVTNTFGANGFYSAPVDLESKEKVQTFIGSAKGKIRITDFWSVRPSFSYRYGADDYVLNRFQPEIYQNKHYTNVFHAELNSTLSTLYGELGMGLETQYNAITSNSLENHSRTHFGFFTNYSFNALPKTLINLGLYTHHNSELGWDFFPTLDLGYQLYPGLRVYAHTGTGMRLPTYTDLYYSGPLNIGNPNLKPEKSRQIGGGLKYRYKNSKFSGEYFYKNTRNFIDWVKEELEDPWETKNYQTIETSGFTFNAELPFLSVTQNLNMGFQASYTYLDPQLKKESEARYSHYALENLKHQLSGRIHLDYLERYSISFANRYEKRLAYKDYLILSARITAKLKDFVIFMNADNLTDVRYTAAGTTPIPGKWLSLGVQWSSFN